MKGKDIRALLDDNTDDGNEAAAANNDTEWKVFIPIQSNSKISKRRYDKSSVINNDLMALRLDRILSRNSMVDSISSYTPRSALSKALNDSYYRTVSSLLRLSNKEMLSMQKFVEIEHFGRVNSSQFIDLMLFETTMHRHFDSKNDLLHSILTLFDLIDVNDDGMVSWNEISDYFVDAAQSRLTKPNKSDLRRFESSNCRDNTQHNNIIIKVKYLKSINSIVCIEKNSHFFRIYSTDLKLKKIIGGMSKYILDVVDLPNFDFIASIACDRSIVFYKVKDSELKMEKIWNMSADICSFAVCGHLIFCGDANGNIFSYSIGTQNGGECEQKYKNHSDAVSKLLVVEDSNLLISGSADSTICILDIVNNEQVVTLNQHNFGVMHLQFDVEQNILFSAGADAYILVWQIPDTDIKKTISDKAASKIKRRAGTSKTNCIVHMEYIQMSNELIVCDQESVFRVFLVTSVYKIQCVQAWCAGNGTVENIILSKHCSKEEQQVAENIKKHKKKGQNLEEEPADWNKIKCIVSKYSKHAKFRDAKHRSEHVADFAVCPGSKNIICAKGALIRFDRIGVNRIDNLMPIISATFNQNTLELIAVTSSTVHIFNMLNGTKVVEFDANIMNKIDSKCQNCFG